MNVHTAGTIQTCHVSALASYSRKLGTSRLHLVPEQAYPAWFSYSVAQEYNRLGGKTPPDFGSNPREIRRRHVLVRPRNTFGLRFSPGTRLTRTGFKYSYP